MKTTNFVLFALMAGIPAAFANFDIYRSRAIDDGPINDGPNVDVGGFAVYQNEANCDEVNSAFIWRIRSDVSGQTGGRCVGGEDCSRPSEVTELELNFGKNYHFTIYEHRNWDLIDPDGNIKGHCFPFPGDNFNCVNEAHGEQGDNLHVTGARYFRCLTNDIDAAALNKAGWEAQGN